MQSSIRGPGPYPMADDVVMGEQLFGKRFAINVTKITDEKISVECQNFISLSGDNTPPSGTITKSEDGKKWWLTWSDGKKEIVCTEAQFKW